jgi:hypothetical protein
MNKSDIAIRVDTDFLHNMCQFMFNGVVVISFFDLQVLKRNMLQFAYRITIFDRLKK